MTTPLTREAALKAFAPAPRQSFPRQEAAPSLLGRIAAWYRDAVTDPATEQEKAEWQQDSF